MLAHRNLLLNAFYVGVCQRFTLGRPDLHSGAVLPLFRLRVGDVVQCRLRCGDGHSGRVISIRKRRLSAIASERATAVYGVPTMYIAQLEHPTFAGRDLKSLRTGVMSGSPCPIELMKRVVDQMGAREITIAYGLTENFARDHADADGRSPRAARADGRAARCRGSR